MWFSYALLSAFFAAVTAILAKVGVEKINSNLAYAIRTIFVLGFAWLVVVAQKHHTEIGQLSQRTWIFLILSGLATALSWMFYFKALQLGDVSRVAPVDKLSMVLTIVLAALFLGEKISWQVFFGAVLMTIGTVVIALAK